MSHAIKIRGVERLLVGALGLVAMGCSDLADGKETYCLTDGQGVGGPCAPPGGEETMPDGPWWCLDKPAPTPAVRPGQTVGLVLPVVEWSRRTPLMGQGLTATLCPTGDPMCASPLNPTPIPIRPGLLGPAPLPVGSAGVPVPEGFDGFIKFSVDIMPTTPGVPIPDEEQFVSDYYYLGGIISGDLSVGPPILMFSKRLRTTIVQNSFPGANAADVIMKGAVAFGVYDCAGQPVSDALVELTQAGATPPNLLPFRLPASRIPLATPLGQPLTTQAAGSAGYLNVPTGFVEVTASQRDGTRIGSVVLGSVPGQLTIGTVRPDYALKADIRGSIPLVNDMGMGAAGTSGN